MEQPCVKIWKETVVIPTYGVGKADKNPMFFEKRIYQGSSGVVYPNPVIEKIYDEKEDKEYIGLFLENAYLKVMVLPELGGRIQMAFDKIRQRHFIYYNQVIKPALVGLTGPWISGGIEFNWPQHHRPSTFDPIDYKIEDNPDGSKTVWVNEIEQMFHTKGMAGFTLHPDRAYIEIKAKLFNRSNLPQTFLWWANPAVKVNDDYQSVFPSDVNAVFDHGKRDVSTFPIATGTYYKVDYSPGTDISRYQNIPVPTSYMAINSEYDFVGGYEHDSKAGLLHVANHHVSPGKKQWTWGHGDFGQAWDRNLTDEDGPYIELMTGMFTDNQPDFTWLMPNEEKSFTQYFLPYRELGVVKNATKDILIGLDQINGEVVIKVFVTSIQRNVRVLLFLNGASLLEENVIVLDPKEVWQKHIAVPEGTEESDFLLLLENEKGRELIRYEPARNKKNAIPQSARAALAPEEIEHNEQLFLTGQHLEQYRHATYSPVPYYEKALERDPKDIRCNNAMGLWYLRRGQFEKSEGYFQKAIETSTARNPNPYDGEPYYNLGVCLKYLGRLDEAYKAFYKSSWSNGWKDSGYFGVAQIDLLRGDFELAIEHIAHVLDLNAANSKAYVLKAAAYRHLNLPEKTIAICEEALKRDGFNLGALFEMKLAYAQLAEPSKSKTALNQLLELARGYGQNFIAYAIDYAAAGLFEEAIDFIELAVADTGTSPLVYYYLAYFNHQSGRIEKAKEWLGLAAKADPYLCFPNRLEEVNVLKLALELHPLDAKAAYYLGNLFYDKRQYQEAMDYWQLSARLDTDFPTTWRNLGIACFNKRNDAVLALDYFERAFALDQTDARILMELDQLYQRLNRAPQERLEFLEKHLETVRQRDDVYLEYIALLNFTGQEEKALGLIKNRQFHPWEGGEGKASGQYIYSLTALAKEQIGIHNFEPAIALLEQARYYPAHLGEGKLPGIPENDIYYWLGCAYEGMGGNEDKARQYFTQATNGSSEPAAAMFYNDQKPDQIFYQGLAWGKLGETAKAVEIFNHLINYADQHRNDQIKVDYFAVSLPNMLIFEDDLDLRNNIHCIYIKGLGLLGLGRTEEAQKIFQEVLKKDAAHLDARIHCCSTEKLDK